MNLSLEVNALISFRLREQMAANFPWTQVVASALPFIKGFETVKKNSN